MIYRRRFAQYMPVAFVVAAMVINPLALPLNGVVQHHSRLANDNLQLQLNFSIASMRKTRSHFFIEYSGQVYEAWMVENTSMPALDSNDMEEVMEWIFLRHNWLILDSSGAILNDEALYVRLAKAAEWARLLVSNSQWTPEGLRAEADTNDELRHLSAAADILNALVKFLADRLSDLLTKALGGPAGVALEKGADKAANLICSAVSAGEDITETWLAASAREKLEQGSDRFRYAASLIEPVANQMDPVYPSSDVPIALSTLEQFYNSVKSGWDTSYRGRWVLGHAYDTNVVAYFGSIAAGLPPGGDCLQLAFDRLMDTLEDSPDMEEFAKGLAFKSEEFRLREDKLRQGALAYRQIFITEGIPDESGAVSPVTELYGSSVAPRSVGDTNTTFTFSVNYSNLNNQAPSYVRLMINGLPIEMSKADLSDENYADGATYQWSSKLARGHYYYYFEACDSASCDPDHVVEAGFLNNFHLEVRPIPDPLVTADPPIVPLDGSSTSTITVVVRDTQGNPVVGETVWFDASSFSSLSPGQTTTDENGLATTAFMPEDPGVATIRALVAGVVGTTTVEAHTVAGGYDIQLSVQMLEGTQTYTRYGLSTWVTYASTGETVYNKTMTLTTNRGTFDNGQQTMSVDICDGEFSTGNCQGYTPVLIVTDPGPVTVIGTIEASSGSVSFEAVVGAPGEHNPGMTVAGTGSSNSGWENDHEAAWSPDGRYLATLSASHVYVWNVLNWRKVADITLGGYPINAVEFSPQGTYLGACATYYLGVFRTSDFSLVWHVYDDNNMEYTHSLAWSDDESKLAVINDLNSIRIYNIDSHTLERTLTVPSSGTTGREELLCVDWQGDWLTAAGYGGVGYIWNSNSWSRSSYDVHLDRIWSCRWLGDASYAAYVDRWQDPYYSIVFVKRSDMTGQRRDFGHRVLSVDWSPSVTEKKVAVTFDGAQPSVRDMSGNEYAVLRNGGEYSIACSPTNLIAVVGEDTKIYAPYDIGKPLVRIDSPTDNTATVESSITVTGIISDVSGIVSARSTVNGVNPSAVTIEDDGSYEITVQLEDGGNEIAVEATDTAGNTRTATVTVQKLYDDQPPTISVVESDPVDGEAGAIFTLSARVVDAMSSVDPETIFANIQYPDETLIAVVPLYDDGATGGDVSAGDGIFTGQWDSAGMPEACYYIDFVAADVEGNTRELENGLAVLIYDLPTISNIAHVPSTPTDSESTTVSASVTDSSGVALVTLYYSTDGGISWTPIGMTYDGSSGRYAGIIGPQSVPSVSYKIRATDGLNNTLESDVRSYSVTLSPCCDFNSNGTVDVGDIQAVASRWRTSCEVPDPDNNSETPNYEALYDIDGNCIITVVDIMLVVKHWGETCP